MLIEQTKSSIIGFSTVIDAGFSLFFHALSHAVSKHLVKD
jgi:hypothetical protein